MKYIRTKHTIFEVVDENEKVYYVRAKSDPTSIYSKSKCQADIVKEGNSIEELCDEFVINSEKYGHVYWSLGIEVFKSLKAKDNFYGAIWTCNGLKYVAELNNKGELKLL